MKITLPSGVVVESDSAIEIDGMVIGPPARTPVAQHNSRSEREIALSQLTTRLRLTLEALPEDGSSVHVDWVAEQLGVRKDNAVQRLSALDKLGLAVRTAKGRYSVAL